jgi:hypothetical protein
MTDILYKEICLGCRVTDSLEQRCSFNILGEEKSCPCIECLVKVTCKKACFDYRKQRSKVQEKMKVYFYEEC